MHAVTHHTLQCSWCMCRADQDLPPGISLPIDIPRSTCAIRVAAAGSVVVAVVAAAAAAGLFCDPLAPRHRWRAIIDETN